jgi:plastocyanin
LIRFWDFRRARYLAPLAAVALVGGTMVACGDDDDDDDDGTATRAATTAAATQPVSDPTTATATGTRISVGDNVFDPDEETVPVGTEVTWQWAGSNPHSVVGTFNGEDVESETQTSGTFEFTFDSAGTFEYQCGVHGAAMAGRIEVE